MKRLLLFATLVIAPSIALAHPLYLFGAIGKAPVLLMMEQDGTALSGWYLYLSQGKQIRLKGIAAPDGSFTFDEFSGSSEQMTGQFEGRMDRRQWLGQWRKPGAASTLGFRFIENGDTLSNLDGRFRCATKKVDRQFGYIYRHGLTLEVSRGAVKAFDTKRGEVSRDGGEQMCSIALDSVKQVKSDVGILLRAGEAADDGSPQCTIRIVGTGDYLYVQMGDSTESGNDCRSSDEAMYCSPRSFWTSMVLNRKTRACVSVE